MANYKVHKCVIKNSSSCSRSLSTVQSINECEVNRLNHTRMKAAVLYSLISQDSQVVTYVHLTNQNETEALGAFQATAPSSSQLLQRNHHHRDSRMHQSPLQNDLLQGF